MFRDRFSRTRQQHGQRLQGLRGQVDSLTPVQKNSALGVERKGIERNASRRAGRIDRQHGWMERFSEFFGSSRSAFRDISAL